MTFDHIIPDYMQPMQKNRGLMYRNTDHNTSNPEIDLLKYLSICNSYLKKKKSLPTTKLHLLYYTFYY